MQLRSHHDEAGYATLAMVVALIAASLGLLERFGSLRALYSQQARNDLKVEAENFGTVVRMMYGKRDFCTSELTKGVFGSSLSALTEAHPFVDPGSALQSSSGKTPQRLRILKAEFIEPAKLFQDGKSYSTELHLTASLDPAGSSQAPVVRMISIPFYFVTNDSAGSLKECAATSYSDSELRTTLEDRACSLLIGSGYRYEPSLHRCSNTGFVAANLTGAGEAK